MQQLSFLPGEMTTRERSLILRALKTLDRHLHEPGVAFTSTRAAREWLILNMAGLEREEFRVLYLNNMPLLWCWHTITRPVKSHPARQTALSRNVWYRHWAWWISGCRTI